MKISKAILALSTSPTMMYAQKLAPQYFLFNYQNLIRMRPQHVIKNKHIKDTDIELFLHSWRQIRSEKKYLNDCCN